MRLVLLFLCIPCLAWGRPTCDEDPLYCPWVIYDGKEATLKDFEPFDPIVLDTTYSPPLKPLQDDKKKLIGYINVAEVEQYRDYFALAKDKGLIIGEDPNWPGNFFVDLRKEAWSRIVLDYLIPNIILEGFHGLYLDDFDGVVALEEKDPEKYKGMKKAAIQLVKLIRVYFPGLSLMLDSSYSILPEVADSIHVEVAESLFTKYVNQGESYTFVDAEIFKKNVGFLHQVQKKFPHLLLFSLDYWYPDQPDVIRKIYAVEREHGFRPYVGTYELDIIIAEPK